MDKIIKGALRVLGVFLLLIVIGLIYWFFKHRHRMEIEALLREEHQIIGKDKRRRNLRNDPDDRVLLKFEHPSSLQDEKNLKGRTLWVSAGAQMDYYPYNGRSVDFGHPAGVLLGAQKILVKDAVEQVAPASAPLPIPHGDGQILLVFNLPEEPNKDYAVAVGDKEGGMLNLYTDEIFFYDDPHLLYAYWGPKIWAAIDQHEAVLGMSERQVRLALGQVSTPRGDIMGDRAVEFDEMDRQLLVTFVNGKAIEIRDVSE